MDLTNSLGDGQQKDPATVVHDVARLEVYVEELLKIEGCSTFEEWVGRFGQTFYRERNELIRELLLQLRPRRVLEFACAGGFLAERLLTSMPSIEAYTCSNFSPRMIAHCRQQLAAFPQCDVRLLDADVNRSADFRRTLEAPYDTVITTSLEHIRFDRDLVRSLPPGTHFVFSVASFDDPEHFRWFTDEETIRARYADLLDLRAMRRTTDGLKWVVLATRPHFRSANDAADVSIIVPCRNAAPYVGALMSSLAAQQFPETTEIVVVDNGSTDASCEIVRRAHLPVPVRMVEAPYRANASYARNVGVAASTGGKLLFLDADDEVEPGYVATMAAALDKHQFVTSRVNVEVLNAAWLRDCHGPPWQQTGVGRYFDFLPAAGPNVGIRRALYEKIRGYPEEFAGSQDIAFSWQALKAGATLHFVPDAVYHYRLRTTLRTLFHQSRNWGASNVLLFKTFGRDGMPGRSLSQGAQDWARAIAGCLRARQRSDIARSLIQFAYCVGRLQGSVRYGVAYL